MIERRERDRELVKWSYELSEGCDKRLWVFISNKRSVEERGNNKKIEGCSKWERLEYPQYSVEEVVWEDTWQTENNQVFWAQMNMKDGRLVTELCTWKYVYAQWKKKYHMKHQPSNIGQHNINSCSNVYKSHWTLSCVIL